MPKKRLVHEARQEQECAGCDGTGIEPTTARQCGACMGTGVLKLSKTAPVVNATTSPAVNALRRDGEALRTIADILDGLPDDAARIRVVRCAAIMLGVEIPSEGT